MQVNSSLACKQTQALPLYVWQYGECTPLCHFHSDMRQVISRLVMVSYESRRETPAAGSRVQSPANVTACNRGREKIQSTFSLRQGPQGKDDSRSHCGSFQAGVSVVSKQWGCMPVTLCVPSVLLFSLLFFNSPLPLRLQILNPRVKSVISDYHVRFKNSLIVQNQIRFQSSTNSASDTSGNMKTLHREELVSGCFIVVKPTVSESFCVWVSEP